MSFFDEIKGYVGFGAEDAKLLAELHPHIAGRFRGFADHFYDVILKHPRAASAITGGQAQVERLKSTLVAWMDSALKGPHDEAYYQRRSRIGRIHVVIGLPQEYMFTAMTVIRLDFQHAIDDLRPVLDGTQQPTRDAVNKLMDLELAIMLRYYQSDSEAKLVARERRVLSDRLVAMQTLTAGLAHEVRNPLNAAKLQLELLERRLKKNLSEERLLEPTHLVHHEIRRLTELLNEFLDFARPAQLVVGENDLVAIAHQVIELERPTAAPAGTSLTLTSLADRVIAWVDPGRVHQIVLNLVRNALEAVEALGAEGKVDVRVAGAVNGGAVITVLDNGPGIPPEVLSRIYEPFFSTKESGTGMGMAIVHSLVELHGGTIQIETVPASTEVTVWLPPRPAN